MRRPILGCESLEGRRLLSQAANLPDFAAIHGVPAWNPAQIRNFLEANQAPTSPAQVEGLPLPMKPEMDAPHAHFALTPDAGVLPPIEVSGYVIPKDSSVTTRPDLLPLESGVHFNGVPDQVTELGDEGPTRIDGPVAPPDGIEFYRFELTSGTPSIRVDAEVFGQASKPDAELWVLNAQGQLIDHMGMPQPGDRLNLLVDSRSPGTPAGSSFLVGISGPSGGAMTAPIGSSKTSVAPADTFSLWVGRDNSNQAPGGSAGSIVSGGSQAGASSASGAIKEEAASPAEVEATTGLGDDSLGPMPTRSLGPSAGVLSDGLTVPPVDRAEAAVVDLSLVDILAEDAAELSRSWKHRRSPADGLVEIRSPGGFPLLGTALAEPETTPESTPDASANPAVEAAANRESDPRDKPEPAQANDRIAGTGALLLGAGLAGGLSYTLMLPDLERKLEPKKPRRPLPWKRK